MTGYAGYVETEAQARARWELMQKRVKPVEKVYFCHAPEMVPDEIVEDGTFQDVLNEIAELRAAGSL